MTKAAVSGTRKAGKKPPKKRTGRKSGGHRHRSKNAFFRSLKKTWQRLGKRGKRLSVAAAVLIAVVIAVTISAHSYFSIPVSSGSYPIKGVDVSSYQGSVDWEKLYKQDIAFAFIKATEGSSHVDKMFAQNWEAVRKTEIRAGAYHFMSLETAGSAQAENFLGTVMARRGMLPPVIDVELYGSFTYAEPSVQHLQSILTPLLKAVKEETGKAPIIYTTPHLYSKYIAGTYDNDIWIADTKLASPLSDGRTWTFCQYSVSGRLEGYEGGVKSIDLDVFNGSRSGFWKYCR